MFNHFWLIIIYSINYVVAFKVGSYNTDQAPTIDIANDTESIQLEQISSSDIDVLCIQELLEPSKTIRYKYALTEAYPYSFSEADIFDFTPRAPCTSDQTDLLLSDCVINNCNQTWPNGELFAACMTTICPEEMFQLLYSECLYCVGFCPTIPGCSFDTIQHAAYSCSVVLEFPINLLDGTMILSKYPIVNTWHIDIPSWMGVQRAITLAEIDVCNVTRSDKSNRLINLFSQDSDDTSNACDDTIIVGCVHLKHCDMTDPISTFFPSSQEQIDLNISSHVQLNAYQSQWILENVMNRNVAPWIGDADHNNVIAVFMAGDFNVGKMLYPENINIWKDAGFISGRDIKGIKSVDNGGTYNANPNGTDLPNELAYRFCVDNACLLQDSDLDHVLVYKGMRRGRNKGKCYIRGIKAISYDRVFTDLFEINGEYLPLSDHWGVSLNFEFKSKNKRRPRRP